MESRNLLLSLAVFGLLTALITEIVGVSLGVNLPAMAGLVFGAATAGVSHVAMIPFRSRET